jgi:oligopeptide transport system substrate-binding protein
MGADTSMAHRTRLLLRPVDLPPVPFTRRYAAPRAAAWALLTLTIAVLVAVVGCAQVPGQNGTSARIGSSDVFTWDPARQSDAGTASVVAQVYEGLTTFDAESNVRPALARTWAVAENGQRLTFELRPNVTYSDGSAITAQDVVDSWLRLIDPSNTTTLSSLLADVQGATDYQQGKADRSAVGLRADGNTVVVDLRRPATYFLAVTASPSLAVVPPAMVNQISSNPPTVVSGAYVPTIPSDGLIHLTANPAYWAGAPALTDIDLVTDYKGTSGAQQFNEGDLDYTGIGSGDASWIAYDANLGPQLRKTDSFGVNYYGFNTTTEPFDNPDVRRAFAEAVDWDRIVSLSGATAATSMVPVGIPGRDDADHRPRYDVADAKALLAAAGYEGGQNFPVVTLATYGVGYEQTVAKELHDNLGVTVNVEALDFEHYLEQVGAARTATLWSLSWIADYPHAHDFLGLLLETGSTSNTGKWSNPEYDALIGQAAATTDPDAQTALYTQAQDILARDVPVVPVSYSDSWALSRTGLEGALTSGVGLIRYAGLQWAPGTGR